MLPATKPSRHTSYWLKHEFERDGFYITNGQFKGTKGTMSVCGYRPIAAYEQNWTFRCRPSYRNLNTREPKWDAERGRYLLEHLEPEQRALFDRLTAAVKKCEPVRTPYPLCVLVADPDGQAIAAQLTDIGCFAHIYAGDLASIANAASEWGLVLTKDPAIAKSIRASACDSDALLLHPTVRAAHLVEPGVVALPTPTTKGVGAVGASAGQAVRRERSRCSVVRDGPHRTR